jgi:hypothetical protein
MSAPHPRPNPRLRRAFAAAAVCLACLLLAAGAAAATLPSGEANAVHTVNGEGEFSVSGMVNPNGGTVTYWFEFLDQAQFQAGAWASATKTKPAETSGGGLVWQEIPALPSGETYHYRLAVENEAQFKGQPQYSPNVRTLMIPKPEPETQPACPNEALRTGPSAKLPDCRAYEQVTPANKEGAQDIFGYGALFGSATVIGVDGEHLILEDTPAKWGPNIGGSLDGKTSYLFTRTPANWTMTSLYPQPQTGGLSLTTLTTVLDTPNLSQVNVTEELYVSVVDHLPTVNYALGPPGGPYTVVASEPEEEDEEHWGRWVGESSDGSVVVIQSPDHELIPGKPTGTTMQFAPSNQLGYDLYEYSGGRLSQVNVYTDGETIGTCGAHMVQGREGGNRGGGQGHEETSGANEYGSIHAVSSDGSRMFFEADPSGCPSAEERERQFREENAPNIELYMRVDGRETVDIGNYMYQGANPEGTQLLLDRRGGEGIEYLSYDTETRSVKRLFSLQNDGLGSMHALSEDGDVYYFNAIGSPLTPEAPANAADIYRYDIPSETLSFVAASSQKQSDNNGGFYTSPDGSDFYFNVESVQGLSGTAPPGQEVQAYRYDSTESVVQCVSCASPFDSQPRLRSVYLPEWVTNEERLSPLASPASENGNFVFFDTPSALLPQDVDGEIPPSEPVGAEDQSFYFSPSSDVYEWRRYGVDGCGLAQGCLALITNGIDGTMNVLLGVDPSGRNVFIGTHSQLAPTDADKQGDIYDARIDGGFPPPPPPPTECEGAACSTPPSAPSDPTQTLLPAPGAGETLVSAAPPQTAKKASQKKKQKGKSGKAKHSRHGRASRRARGSRKRSEGSSRRGVR